MRPKGVKGSEKMIQQCKCPLMKKIWALFYSWNICEEFKDALSRYDRYQKVWRHQANEKRKQEMIKKKQVEGLSEKEIIQFLTENADQLQCQKCNGQCHSGTKYQNLSKSPKDFMTALLCNKVHTPPLHLPALNINFYKVPGETDKFLIHHKRCCYGNHCRFESSAAGTTELYKICGWDGMFRSMPRNKIKEFDLNFSEEIIHCVNACP